MAKHITYQWKNPAYLKTGNPKQKNAFATLQKLNIFPLLDSFNPVLVGTIPIAIDTEDSDLDIINEVYEPGVFKETLTKHFRDSTNFSLYQDEIKGILSTIAHFDFDGFKIEVFGQPLPVEKQDAFRHMVVEHRILVLMGNGFKEKIIALKENGIKTEPAFGRLLGLDNDPYKALLDLERLSDKELAGFPGIPVTS
ncbi:MAG: DUF4269 domain-containing protein [bacterium]|nr:DUF4269 domain-containing protein [bacterium]